MKLTVSARARAQLRAIAEKDDSAAYTEGTTTYVLLEHLDRRIAAEDRAYWDQFKTSDDRIRLISTLRGNIPVWQLYPEHTHCIALIVEVGERLSVERFCAKAELNGVLIQLIDGK